MSTFGSLYTVRSGLFAARRALDTIGRNVAQAGVPGYSRQEVAQLSAQPSHQILSSGQGVKESLILRYRDQFLDRQYRQRAGHLGYQQARSEALLQAEALLNAAAEGGLGAALDRFFNSWEQLSLRPSDGPARAQTVAVAGEFLDEAQRAFTQLAGLRVDLDQAIQAKVQEVNLAATRIAELNLAFTGGQPHQPGTNAIADERDRLIDSLARLAGTTAIHHQDGSLTVLVGSLPLVDRHLAYPVALTDAVEPDLDPDPALASLQQRLTLLSWNGVSPVPVGGELAGLTEARDQAVPAVMLHLDRLVRGLAEAVNGLHTAGVPAADQVEVFTLGTPASWMNIQVNPALTADPDLLLAAADLPATAGDGERARQIASLRAQAFLTGPPVGARLVAPGEFLRAITVTLGQQAQAALRTSEGAALQVAQAEQQRESVAGVSLDDEMTKMVQFQQAYGASARVMTAIDEMLEVLISRTGVTGR